MSAQSPPVTVVALLAPAVGRLDVDPLTGAVTEDVRGAVMSRSDAAALEVALRLGATWQSQVVALSAGGPTAVEVLRKALAVGADRAVHIDVADRAAPARVAGALAEVVSEFAPVMVVAGVHGSDVASAAVPAFLAHELGAAQALGLISVEPVEPGCLEAVRRIDRGARERVRLSVPGVVSVEGAVATLRRAPLAATLTATEAAIDHRSPTSNPSSFAEEGSTQPRPFRPRARLIPPPSGSSALERIRDLTGTDGSYSPAQSVELNPADAAEAILDQLGAWGYGPRSNPDE